MPVKQPLKIEASYFAKFIVLYMYTIMINWLLVTGFDWDSGNAQKNEAHAVAQTECEQIFFNEPLLIFSDEKHSQNEIRYHALGRKNHYRLLHVTFTLRKDLTEIRVISARDMHKKERAKYETT